MISYSGNPYCELGVQHAFTRMLARTVTKVRFHTLVSLTVEVYMIHIDFSSLLGWCDRSRSTHRSTHAITYDVAAPPVRSQRKVRIRGGKAVPKGW